MSYADKIKAYSEENDEFVEKVYSVKEQQEIARKLGITEDDYPRIQSPEFKKPSFFSLLCVFFRSKTK